MTAVKTTEPAIDKRSVAELTHAVFGQELSLQEACDALGLDEFLTHEPPASTTEAVWVGSIGYERYQDPNDFAQVLQGARVERLIDVRELPISRRKGYAKSALRTTLEAAGIEYLHLPALGNPKRLRDLYKSGQRARGRRLYSRLLLTERRNDLDGLADLLGDRRSALMCVEHDEAHCHRRVILDALNSELGLALAVCRLG